jgi:hypothetical protein
MNTKTDELIKQVEAAFSEGLPYAYVEVGRYKYYNVATVRALKSRGYRVERRVLGGAYLIFPKPVVLEVERTYVLALTRGELIAIREMARKITPDTEFSKDYAREIFNLDNKTTAKLSEIVDSDKGLKKY